MSDDLDLRGIDQHHEPDPEFRAALRRRVLDIAAGTDPSDTSDPTDLATIGVEPINGRTAQTRRGWVGGSILALTAAAAAVAATLVVISRHDVNTPADAPSTAVQAASTAMPNSAARCCRSGGRPATSGRPARCNGR